MKMSFLCEVHNNKVHAAYKMSVELGIYVYLMFTLLRIQNLNLIKKIIHKKGLCVH